MLARSKGGALVNSSRNREIQKELADSFMEFRTNSWIQFVRYARTEATKELDGSMAFLTSIINNKDQISSWYFRPSEYTQVQWRNEFLSLPETRPNFQIAHFLA